MSLERTIGESLRLAREEKGMTLEDVRDKTRISLSVLHNLEQDRFSELPNPIYVRNYLRTLAGLYGLDIEPLLERYDEGVRGGPETVREEVLWREEPVKETRLTGWRPGIRSWLVLLGVVLLVMLWFWAPWKGEDEQAPRPRPALEEAGEELLAPLPEGTELPFLPEGSSAGPLQRPESVLSLRIVATGEAEVLLNVDDRRNVSRRFGREGGDWLVEGLSFYYLSASGVDHLTLSLDGRPLVLPEAPGGEVEGWRIDALSAGGTP